MDVLRRLVGDFTELRFEAAGGPDSIFIDNVTYVPSAGTIALATMGLGTMLPRRRR